MTVTEHARKSRQRRTAARRAAKAEYARTHLPVPGHPGIVVHGDDAALITYNPHRPAGLGGLHRGEVFRVTTARRRAAARLHIDNPQPERVMTDCPGQRVPPRRIGWIPLPARKGEPQRYRREP